MNIVIPCKPPSYSRVLETIVLRSSSIKSVNGLGTSANLNHDQVISCDLPMLCTTLQGELVLDDRGFIFAPFQFCTLGGCLYCLKVCFLVSVSLQLSHALTILSVEIGAHSCLGIGTVRTWGIRAPVPAKIMYESVLLPRKD